MLGELGKVERHEDIGEVGGGEVFEGFIGGEEGEGRNEVGTGAVRR